MIDIWWNLISHNKTENVLFHLLDGNGTNTRQTWIQTKRNYCRRLNKKLKLATLFETQK